MNLKALTSRYPDSAPLILSKTNPKNRNDTNDDLQLPDADCIYLNHGNGMLTTHRPNGD